MESEKNARHCAPDAEPNTPHDEPSALDAREEFFKAVDELVALGLVEWVEVTAFQRAEHSQVDPDDEDAPPGPCGHRVPELTGKGWYYMEVLRDCRHSPCPECTLFFAGDTCWSRGPLPELLRELEAE